MNKRYLSFIVILCTFITSSIMLTFNAKEAYVEEEILVRNDYEANGDEFENKIREYRETIDNEEMQLKDGSALPSGERDKDSSIGEEDNENIVTTQDNTNLNIDTYEDYMLDDEKDASVFKVSTNIIREEVNLKEKQKLFSIAVTNLHPTDLLKIKEYLYWKDEEEGVRRIIDLIKEKLDCEDYKKVKDILDEYIYM